MNAVDWSSLPTHATWRAFDKYRKEIWFDRKPKINAFGVWQNIGDACGVIPHEHARKLVGKWQDSLIGRDDGRGEG